MGSNLNEVKGGPGGESPQLELRVEEKEIILENTVTDDQRHEPEDRRGFEGLEKTTPNGAGKDEGRAGMKNMSRVEEEVGPAGVGPVPVLNLSALQERQEKMSRRMERRKSRSDPQLVRGNSAPKELESYQLKFRDQGDGDGKERKSDRLSKANLQLFMKAQDPDSRYQNLTRVRQWVHESSPPYDVNPSGVSSSFTRVRKEPEGFLTRLCSCFRGR